MLPLRYGQHISVNLSTERPQYLYPIRAVLFCFSLAPRPLAAAYDTSIAARVAALEGMLLTAYFRDTTYIL